MRSTGPVLEQESLYAQHVNPQWPKLLDVLQMNVQYESCAGAELRTSDGRRILDFISGYCVHNVGHNHPKVIQAIKDELDRKGPAMLQRYVSELAGELGTRLCARAGGRLTKAYFGCSGSDGIDTVIKFARARTGRGGILYAEGGFHGLTCSALSLMANPFWKRGFGPFLPGTESIPFGNLDALAAKLSTRRFAAFLVEPVQAESGVLVPSQEYLQQAQALCRRYGALFALDEVQTGMYRTGPFLAGQHFGLEPDMVVLAKALSGGLVPCAAVLMSDAVCDAVYDSLARAGIHTSTFSENSLAMRAGLATLDVLEDERLGDRARTAGERLRQRLAARLMQYDMVRDIRGLGLLCGIQFAPPRQLKLRVPFEACARLHPALFGEIMVMRLFRDGGMLTQVCGNDFMVLKVAPPLVVDDAQLEAFVAAVEDVVRLMHSSMEAWTDALKLAHRAL